LRRSPERPWRLSGGGKRSCLCVIVDNARRSAGRGPVRGRCAPNASCWRPPPIAAFTAASPPANTSAAAITVNTSIEVSRFLYLINHSMQRFVFAA
jgi:hypothetical protein